MDAPSRTRIKETLYCTELRTRISLVQTLTRIAYGPPSSDLAGVPAVPRDHQAPQGRQRSVPKELRGVSYVGRGDLPYRGRNRVRHRPGNRRIEEAPRLAKGPDLSRGDPGH